MSVVRARRPRRRGEHGIPRATTITIRNIKRQTFALGALIPSDPRINRPRTRSDCYDSPRPCPFVGCRHHLYLDVNPETGTIKLNRPDLQPEDLRDSCSLDIAELGPITLEEVGDLTNLTRERVRQIEVRALIAMRRSNAIDELDPDFQGESK